MENRHIYAVLLAGGRGRRLWPVSKPGFSKSFIGFKGYAPPILSAIDIAKSFCRRNNLFVVTTRDQKRLVKGLRKIPERSIISEPFSRNTASAIGLAALRLLRKDPEARMVIMPTDQYIRNKKGFRKAVSAGARFINRNGNSLVVMGLRPRYPSPSFGYIKLSGGKKQGLCKVSRFLEKPSPEKAKRFYKNKNFCWNAGIFIWRADTFLKAVKTWSPGLYKGLERVQRCVEKNAPYPSLERAYGSMKDVSVDYQLLEKARGLFCVKADFQMCDIGSWESLGRLYPPKKNGNIIVGEAEVLDSRNSIVYNTEKHKLALVGMEDAVVVHTKEGTLVCGRQAAEKVRHLGRRKK